MMARKEKRLVNIVHISQSHQSTASERHILWRRNGQVEALRKTAMAEYLAASRNLWCSS